MANGNVFSLGNTLAQAEAIRSARNRNALAEQGIRQRNELDNAIRSGADANELSQLGLGGLEAAQGMNRLEMGIAQLDGARQTQALQRAALAHRAALGVANSNNPLQAAVLAMKDPTIKEMFGSVNFEGMTSDEIRAESQAIADALAFTQDPQRIASLQRGQGVVVQTPEGNAFVTPVFNPQTGEVQSVTTPFEGKIASRAGETPQQRQQREVDTAEQKATATAAAKSDQALIDVGLESADALPVLRRTRELLGVVQTGGAFREAQLAFLQQLGLEGADRGELSANLGKAVLSQLRETFGAQFTQQEGERLERIEAGFGRSNATNIRLIDQAIDVMERKTERAIRAAERRGNDAAAEELELLLFPDIDEPEAPAFDFSYDPQTGQLVPSNADR